MILGNLPNFFGRLWRSVSTNKYTGLVGDTVKILRDKENFILGELTDRSLQSPNGCASTYIGLPFFKLVNFVVLTGKDVVPAGVEYGEHSSQHFDPKTRSLFDPVTELLGHETIVNQNDARVLAERKAIKQYLTIDRAHEATWEVFNKVVNEWSPEKSINDTVCFACTQIIAKAWFNITDLEEDIVPILKKAEHYVFNRENISNSDFNQLKDQLRQINDDLLEKNEEQILEENSYLKHMYETRKATQLKQLNAIGSLIVEGNITTVLTGAILQLATTPKLQAKLRKELNKLTVENFDSLEDYMTAILHCKYLHAIYLEALRYFSPSPPIARWASKKGNIKGNSISARSYIFIPMRRILHDQNHWPNPQVFDPTRHLENPRSLNTYPFVPFSVGRRGCPASLGFAEAIFKNALIALFQNHELTLTSHQRIETIPITTKEPRFKQTYQGTLQNIKELNLQPIVHAFSSIKRNDSYIQSEIFLDLSLDKKGSKNDMKVKFM